MFYWPLKDFANFVRLGKAITSEAASVENGLRFDQDVLANLPTRTYAALLDGLMTAWVRDKGKVRWGDKSPGYISKLRILWNMYPGAKVIHIIRDGRDVWLSLQELGWERNVVKVAQDWQNSVLAARRYARRNRPQNYIEVRYEDLVTQPQDAVRRVAEFLGEEYSDELLKSQGARSRNAAFKDWPKIHEHIDGANVSRWRREVTDHELVLFEIQAKEALGELGYKIDRPQPTMRVRFSYYVHFVRGVLEKATSTVRRRMGMLLRTLRQRYVRNGAERPPDG